MAATFALTLGYPARARRLLTEPVDLLLRRDVAYSPAGYWMSFWRFMICQSFPARSPEDSRYGRRKRPIAARIIVEYCLDRRVRQDPAIPIELAVDAHGRKRRRQRARSHDVPDVQLLVATVEVAHPAGSDVRCADSQPGRSGVEREVDELANRLAKRSHVE